MSRPTWDDVAEPERVIRALRGRFVKAIAALDDWQHRGRALAYGGKEDGPAEALGDLGRVLERLEGIFPNGEIKEEIAVLKAAGKAGVAIFVSGDDEDDPAEAVAHAETPGGVDLRQGREGR